jgi:small nuclear ribonucleoprotein E
MSGQPQRVQRMMTLPINIIFRLLQHKQRVQLWLYDHTDLRVEGRIVGLDEYMNLVLDDAEEIGAKKDIRRKIGRVLLKGDSITLIQAAPTAEEA